MSNSKTPIKIKPFVVCSDATAGQIQTADSDDSFKLHDLKVPATTSVETLQAQWQAAAEAPELKVIFSTYQSLEVIHQAQQSPQNPLPQFGLVIADEAHRTAGNAEGGFARIHRQDYIQARRRLYMTATPRLYRDTAKRSAKSKNIYIASMDDEKLYGPEFHRLSFAAAIRQDLLVNYEIVALHVDLDQLSQDYSKLLSDQDETINLDDLTRIVGCWDGLQKQGKYISFADDPQPARRAVAFSNTISASKRLVESFPVAAKYRPANAQTECVIRHVDGTMNAAARRGLLSWLSEDNASECRILTNARCLQEGVDVTNLDAVLFMEPRKSVVDVIQAVGRVMRKSPGKKKGYIIIPIAHKPGVSPQDAINSTQYQTLLQVISALRAHDEAIDIAINQLFLEQSPGKSERPLPDPIKVDVGQDLRDAIIALIIDRYSDPNYLQKWAREIYYIAARHEARIKALLESNAAVRESFDRFLQSVRLNINEQVGDAAAIAMLSQHLVVQPVFQALLPNYDLNHQNPVSQALEHLVADLYANGLKKETDDLDDFYAAVRRRVEGITDPAARQRVIKDFYEFFLKHAAPKAAAQMGIVHTPIPVIDYILRGVETLLQKEFNLSLGDRGVHILDPFAGTGSFLTRAMQATSVRDAAVQKYAGRELHANEINLLAYYVATLNIETVYQEVTRQTDYTPFQGLVLTDTFERVPGKEKQISYIGDLFHGNSSRLESQTKQDIRVIVSNPPWSKGQKSENDDNRNFEYPVLRDRIRETYGRQSTANNKNSLMDSYIHALRWASDRLDESPSGGVIGFITNSGFIRGQAAAGLRKSLSQEFTSVYCYDLRGNARTSGEQRKKEKDSVFGGHVQAGAAILFLVKNPNRQPDGYVHYADIGNYLSTKEKLDILNQGELANTPWRPITPDRHGDWLDHRNDDFQKLVPLGGDSPERIFLLTSNGVKTNRDSWVHNYSLAANRQNFQTMVEFYEEQKGKTTPDTAGARFKWDRDIQKRCVAGKPMTDLTLAEQVTTFAPFNKMRLTYGRYINNQVYRTPRLLPSPQAKNLIIAASEKDKNYELSVIITDCVPNVAVMGTNTRCLPRWTYQEGDMLGGEPADNINPVALGNFRRHCDNAAITADDLFYYTYAVLHHPGYKESWATDLKKEPARIPYPQSNADFQAFAHAGRELAELHLTYETIAPFPLREVHTDRSRENRPDYYRVQKMALDPEKGELVFNANITLQGIPPAAFSYQIGQYNALRWLVERYQVKTDSESGIVNNPNDWAVEHDQPRYILDLVQRVVAVSVKTMDIIDGLPDLD